MRNRATTVQISDSTDKYLTQPHDLQRTGSNLRCHPADGLNPQDLCPLIDYIGIARDDGTNRQR